MAQREGGVNDQVRRVTEEDWKWLAGWAADPVVDHELGPLDRAWLEHVLAEDTGVELVITDCCGRPLALVGCVWDPSGRSHVISDIAVDPSRRRAGLGRRAIDAALAWNGHPYAAEWTAYVSPENTAALRFFSEIGWLDRGMQDAMQQFTTRGRSGESSRRAAVVPPSCSRV